MKTYIKVINIFKHMLKYILRKQTKDIDEEIVASHDPINEWFPDPKGYFLIRINKNKMFIEVGFVTNDHVIRKIITGTYAIEIYNTIIRHKLISRLEHAAYLGKELYKAELALKYDLEYKQEFPLKLPGAINQLPVDS